MFHHFHPYEPFIKNDTKKIIVGTLPPPRFCTKEYKPNDVDFCYGSSDGLLWKVLDVIFDLKLEYLNTKEEIKRRKDFLIYEKIGVCDIVDNCKREKIDASDIGMSDVNLRDILNYLKLFENINTIIFTGGNSKNGPEYFLRRILKEANIKFIQISDKIPKVHEFTFDNRIIRTISLTSPSNAANRFIGSNSLYKENKMKNSKYTTFDFRVEQYRKVFKALN